MGLDRLLDNPDNKSKHILRYDKQMHQITPKLLQGQSPYMCVLLVSHSPKVKSVVAARPAVFVLMPNLRQVNRMISNDHEH